MKPHAAFALLASIAALAFAFVTPPFQSPDEVGHFWRAASIGEGAILPKMTVRGPAANVPRGIRDFVAATWFDSASLSAKASPQRIRAAWAIPLQANEKVEVRFPAFYTPVPSLATTAAYVVGRVLSLRPMLIFYLGRLANTALYIALIALAIRWTPVAPWAFCAAALLPMPLFLAGSWSTDTATTAFAFLLVAAALRTKDKAAPLLALAVALCKGAYAPMAILDRRRLSWIAMLAGFLISGAVAKHEWYNMRRDPAVNPHEQMTKCVAQPAYAQTLLHDLRANGGNYAEQMVGRLGWLDVVLPRWLIDAELLMLAFAAVASGADVAPRTRLLSIAALLLCIVAIETAQYVVWTPACADYIEGVQGRYFVALLPLIIVALSARFRLRLIEVLVPLLAIVADTIAVRAVFLRYY